ncbi:MAG: hypothetical protein HZB38_08845 [Planctomycetes bacterium]|nr:hypothetical protein [Planctomycetota bacterium]
MQARKVGLLAIGLCLIAACDAFKAAVYYLQPKQTQKAEFTFPNDAVVAVMLDPAQPEYESPVFNRAFHDRLVEIFREHKSNARLIPQAELLALRRANADFDKWPVRHVGQELGATHVLYVRIDKLLARPSADSPILEPIANLRIKVIGVNLPDKDARLWPTKEEKDRAIQATRRASEADPGQADSELAKLGREIAYLVAAPFFEIDLEEKPPHES